MTQTQKTTPEAKKKKKKSKTKNFLVNILTLKSDPIVLSLETRSEASWVALAVSLTSPPWLSSTIASMLPEPHGCLGLEIRKEAERREKGRRREGADAWQPQERGSGYEGQ
jgi:hypothetical protein